MGFQVTLVHLDVTDRSLKDSPDCQRESQIHAEVGWSLLSRSVDYACVLQGHYSLLFSQPSTIEGQGIQCGRRHQRS